MQGETLDAQPVRGEPKIAKGTVLAAAVGIAAGFILSFAYSPLCHWIPLIYVNLVVTLAFGYAIGAACRAVIRVFRIDRPVAAVAAGGVAGIAGWYFAWATYLWTITEYDFGFYKDSLLAPSDLWFNMRYIAHDPVWSIGKTTSEPWLYYAVWIGEFLLLVGTCIYVPWNFIREHRLCETCKDWLAPTGDALTLDIADAEPSTLDALKRGELDGLAGLPVLSAEALESAGSWLEVKAFACPNCEGADAFVDVLRHTVKRDKKGKEKEKSATALGRQMPVSGELEARLFGAGAEAKATTSPAAPEADAGDGQD